MSYKQKEFKIEYFQIITQYRFKLDIQLTVDVEYYPILKIGKRKDGIM